MLSAPKAFVYILRSKRNGRYYIGQTTDPEARLQSHNAGLVKATRYQRPWTLAYTESCPDLTAARKREYELKRWKSRKLLDALVNSDR